MAESRGVLRCPFGGPRFKDCALEENPSHYLKDTEADVENGFSVHGTMESNRCSAKDRIDNAVATCPFLRRVRHVHGEQYTRRLVVNPFIAAREEKSEKHAPLFPEDEGKSFHLAFQLFHGPTLGTIPLAREESSEMGKTPVSVKSKQHTETRAGNKEQRGTTVDWQKTAEIAESKEACPRCPREGGEAAALPPLMASISLSGFHFLPDPKSFMLQLRGQKGNKQKRSAGIGGSNGKPGGADASKPVKSGPSGNGISGPNGRGTLRGSGTVKGSGVGSMISSPSVGGHGMLKPPTNQRNTGNGGGPESGSDSFWKGNPIGGLLPLAGAKGLQCPAAIVSMRAAVARMKAVRHLRPQALPIRALALASVAISFNIPCGMLREHTKKFSPQWILAVHATIPFVAMLRKAVMMPAWGLGLTVLGSIAGQHVGNVLEKKRLQGTLRLPKAKRLYNNSLPRGIKLRDIPRQAVLTLLPDNHPLAVQ